MGIKLAKPTDCPISSAYGVAGKHWLWHLENGIWVKGQKDGMGNHRGYDFKTPIGTPVFACTDGFISRAGWEVEDHRDKGFGLRIIQSFVADGKAHILFYGHLSQLVINEGRINKGQVIAMSGNTGRSSGPHLHVEVRDLNQISQPIEWV